MLPEIVLSLEDFKVAWTLLTINSLSPLCLTLWLTVYGTFCFDIAITVTGNTKDELWVTSCPLNLSLMVTFQKWWQLILHNLYLSCAYSWFEVYFVARIWGSGTNPDDWLRLSWRGTYTGCPSPEDSQALWTTFVLFSGLKLVTLSFICLWRYIALSGYYSLLSLQ